MGGTADGIILMPTDLAQTTEAKPHAVFIDDDETSVHVMYIDLANASYVVRFAKDGGGTWGRAQVRGDAHGSSMEMTATRRVRIRARSTSSMLRAQPRRSLECLWCTGVTMKNGLV